MGIQPMNMMLPNYMALFENGPYPQGIGNSLGKLMSFFGGAHL
jgi:hypothetical protein